jgi:hypothetical protein
MLTAVTKLADIAARSLFVLLVLYGLPERSAGQFGLALTLVVFFSFTAGFERYLDLQRRMVGSSALQTDQLLVSAVRFYANNYLLCLPILFALLMLWVDLPLVSALLCLVIAVGEHISAEVYRIAMIAPRHRLALFAALVKNLVLLGAIVLTMLTRHESFNIEWVFQIWALLSFIGIVLITIAFSRTWAFASLSQVGGAGLPQLRQFHASRTHFMIGLVAVTLLQADRLVAGALLTLDQSGVYFRHILLATFAYQVFNVASYGRVAPRVYEHLHANRPASARAIIRRELMWLASGAALVMGAFYLAASLKFSSMPAIHSINPNYLAILTLAYMGRAFADFNALLLNGVYSERDVFVSQSMALGLAVVLNITLTHFFGMAGTVATVMIGSCAYYAISSLYVRKNPSLNGSVTS